MKVTEDSIFEGNLTVLGAVNLQATANVQANAMDHQHNKTYSQSGAAVAATVVLHEVRGTGAILKAVRAGTVTLCTGTSTITIDIKKNGTTVLSATIVLDTGNVVYVSEAGTIPNPTLTQGDVLTAVITIATPTGAVGTGLWITVLLDEDYGS